MAGVHGISNAVAQQSGGFVGQIVKVQSCRTIGLQVGFGVEIWACGSPGWVGFGKTGKVVGCPIFPFACARIVFQQLVVGNGTKGKWVCGNFAPSGYIANRAVQSGMVAPGKCGVPICNIGVGNGIGSMAGIHCISNTVTQQSGGFVGQVIKVQSCRTIGLQVGFGTVSMQELRLAAVFMMAVR